VCAAFNDIEFSKEGYFWMFINCCVTAVYVLYMKWSMDETGLNKDSMALYNNAIGVPIILALVLVKEQEVVNYGGYDDLWFMVVLVVSGIVGFAMSISTFYAISKTTPTTYSMVGALNKIPASILGAIFFRAEITSGGWAGIGIGLCGGIVFAWVKAMESRKPAPAAPKELEDVNDDQDVQDKLISSSEKR